MHIEWERRKLFCTLGVNSSALNSTLIWLIFLLLCSSALGTMVTLSKTEAKPVFPCILEYFNFPFPSQVEGSAPFWQSLTGWCSVWEAILALQWQGQTRGKCILHRALRRPPKPYETRFALLTPMIILLLLMKEDRDSHNCKRIRKRNREMNQLFTLSQRHLNPCLQWGSKHQDTNKTS